MNKRLQGFYQRMHLFYLPCRTQQQKECSEKLVSGRIFLVSGKAKEKKATKYKEIILITQYKK
jgi:hypothetical protein